MDATTVEERLTRVEHDCDELKQAVLGLKSKVDSIRSLLFAALRVFYQERDRLRLLVQFRKVFIAC